MTVQRALGLVVIIAMGGVIGCSGEDTSAILPVQERAKAVEAPRDTTPTDLAQSAWLDTVKQRIAIGRYQLRPVASGYDFVNPDLQLRVKVKPDGAHFTAPVNPTSDARLTVATDTLTVDGRTVARDAEAPRPGQCARPTRIDEMGQCIKRIERAFGPVTEWWQNDPRQLAQGWTFGAALQGSDSVGVTLRFDGARLLEPRGPRDLMVRMPDARHDLRVGNLFVYDAERRTVPAQIVVDGLMAHITVDTRDAVFPVTIDPTYTTMTQGWTATGDQDGGGFGFDVAGAGDVNGDGYDDVLVGAHQYNDGARLRAGRVFLFYGGPEGVQEAPVWTFVGEAANDNLGTALDGVGDVNGDGFADVVIGAPRYRGTERNEGRVYGFYGSGLGLAAAPDWTWEGGVRNADAGSAISAIGDINGDNFADFAVGAPGHTNEEADEGRVVVFYGSEGGFPDAPSWSLESDIAGTGLGYAVAGGRDFNGDGFDDLAIGAPNYNGNAGRVYLVLGGEEGFAAAPDRIFNSVGQAGFALDFCDTDGDGFADLYFGRPGANSRVVTEIVGGADVENVNPGASVASDGVFTGRALSCAGDINADGFEDLAVSRARLNNEDGGSDSILIRYGSADRLWSTASETIQPDQNNLFGSSLDAAGDVDGDGLPDLVVGAPSHTFGLVDPGKAYVFRGVRSHLRHRPHLGGTISDQNNSYAASTVARVGDHNGDGYNDVAVGGYGRSNSRGAVWLFLGGADGLAAAAHRRWDGADSGMRFGQHVAGDVDLNGDGYHDIIVGAPHYANNTGRVFIFLGAEAASIRPNGAGTQNTEVASPSGTNDYFGYTVTGLRDTNGDGFDDFAVSCWGEDDAGSSSGRAYFYFGNGGNNINTTHDAVWSDRRSEARFGWFVANAGDVNGDGLGDLVISQPWLDNGQDNEGKLYVYHGQLNRGPALTTTIESNEVSFLLGRSLAMNCDVNGDGFSDVVAGGNLGFRVYLGSPAGITTTPALSRNGSGYNVTCGDVNSDGFDDIVSTDNNHSVFLHLGGETLQDQVVWYALENGQGFGSWTANASIVGDLNGDGAEDLVVGASRYNSNRGRLFFYYGVPGASANAADFTIASAGDINGDGHDDIALGQGNYTDTAFFEGRILVFPGGRQGVGTSAIWSRNGGERLGLFGKVMSSAGDVDDDGDDELLVGIPMADSGRPDAGRIEVYAGSEDGLSADPAWSYSGTGVRAQLGGAVSYLGDINDDGYGDIVASEPNYANGHALEGRILVFLGGPDGLEDAPAWTREENVSGARLGHSLSKPVDLDANTFNDLVVGAPGWGARRGAAIVYMNTTDNQYFAKLRTIQGVGTENLGHQIAVGDFNGDFIDDFAVSGPYFLSDDGDEVGRVAWAPGSFTGPGAAVTTVAVGDVDARFGMALEATDFTGDDRVDLVVGSPRYTADDLYRRGKLEVFPSTADGPSAAPVFSAMGSSLRLQMGRGLTTGDFNGDGIGDVAAAVLAKRFFVYFGGADEEFGTQRVSLGAQNAPIAQPQSVVTNIGEAIEISLEGVDVDGDELTYTIVDEPDNGALVGEGADVTYTPADGFTGSDTFQFRVNDGVEDSNVATVTVRVNTPPTAAAVNGSTARDTALDVVLVGADADDDPLTYAIVDQPATGALAGRAPNLVYTPDGVFVGDVTFTYRVNDGYVDSAPATVTITVREGNRAPTAADVAADVAQGGTVEVALAGADEDGDQLTYAIADEPAQGVAELDGDTVTFTAPAGFAGDVTLTYVVNDGTVDSAPATVTITVLANVAPTAEDIAAITDEDTAVTVTLLGADAEGAAVVFEITEQPGNGEVVLNGDEVTYTPSPDFNGEDSFTYVASDGLENSAPATVTITVNAVDDPPTAEDLVVTLDEDDRGVVNLVGADADGDPLTYGIVTAPTHGDLVGEPPNLTYVPRANFNGEDRAVYRVTTGFRVSRDAEVRLVVRPVNDPPTMADVVVTVPENAATEILLVAEDIEGDALSFAVVDGPQNGQVAGAGPAFVYTPNDDYLGADAFVVAVSDGVAEPVRATVSVVVRDVNAAPTAEDSAVTGREDQDLAVAFPAVDDEGDDLTVEIIEAPRNGRLVGEGLARTYTPNANFNGEDTVVWRVSDGRQFSEQATLTITIESINDAPEVTDQALLLDEDTDVEFELDATDIDGDALEVTILEAPEHGRLEGEGLTRGYVPNADFNGNDSFTWRVSDGTTDSEVATVSITVNAIDDAPIATALTLSTLEDTELVLPLAGTDDGEAPLAIAIDEAPGAGLVTQDGDRWVYTPNANFNGADRLTYRVNDGAQASAPAVVDITVEPVNDRPIAQPGQFEVDEGELLVLELAGEDVDGDALRYRIVEPPSGGGLVGALPNVTYRPDVGFSGQDAFSFVVSDGAEESAPAVITIRVNPVNDAPTAQDQQVVSLEDQEAAITLGALDPEGAPLVFELVTLPEHGILRGAGADRTYVPTPNFHGQDSFTFRVNDGTQWSEAGTVQLLIQPVNDAPTGTAASYDVIAGEPFRLTLAGRDVDEDELTFVVVTPPSQGQLAGAGAEQIYTANDGFSGVDFIEFTAGDGVEVSAPTRVSFLVSAVNGAPVARDVLATTNEDTPVEITLAGVDPDDDQLSYQLLSQPQRGVLEGEAPALRYVPNADLSGEDSFTYLVNDGQADSVAATVTIQVRPVNDLPQARGSQFALFSGQTLPIILSATDPDGDMLTYRITGFPMNGVVAGQAPNLEYTSARGFVGEDRILFVAEDAEGASEPAEITLIVQADPNASDQDEDGLTDDQELGLGLDPTSDDSDEDGIPDADEVGDPENPTDTDEDGVIDALDEDADGDGIADAVERGEGRNPADTDDDGTPDYLDTDSDGDGVDDDEDLCALIADESGDDLDGDDIGDECDPDLDGDGIDNVDDACPETAGDAPDGCEEMEVDAAIEDAAVVEDAGMIEDAGVVEDAAPVDAAPMDSAPDVASETMPDAEIEPTADAAAAPADTASGDEGCACDVGADTPSPVTLLLLLLGAWGVGLRRRRR